MSAANASRDGASHASISARHAAASARCSSPRSLWARHARPIRRPAGSAVAIEELNPEEALEVAHLDAERRLRHDELAGGVVEVERLRDGDEGLQWAGGG